MIRTELFVLQADYFIRGNDAALLQHVLDVGPFITKDNLIQAAAAARR
ncbi:hypothetical protein M2281_003714 [Mesorhizobium soli]|nr:hypothetical protein [Mesorhizobium soli]MDH6233103.1 hypothetical protein [Mesorhizobium soli]